ncbi:MAG TPA: murein biosynthesis integral membrane protein MurJ [Bryobacteraceae bacterium]|nr:murein biosynthesis integral membrane protein MurJ [Bryobacteraceae bacterium]
MQLRIRISHRPNRRVPPGPVETETAGPVTQVAVGPANLRPGALSGSTRVALGILATRLTGLARERAIAFFFGNSAVAGAFRAAFRIPNLLSNLFGEGVLSAAFITVYAKLRAKTEDQEAEDLAAAVFGALACVSSVLVLIGILVAPLLVDAIAPGFQGEDRTLTIRLVRILFPGAGALVMSAWCLGVLNSHRRFLLSYSAPIAMNATMISALVLFGTHSHPQQLVVYLAWASVIGSVLTFLVQLPSVLRLLPDFWPALDFRSENVRTVIRNFGPVFVSRGVVQISAYVDQMIASFLGAVAVSTLGYAQIISVLPVSLFSMSVSAAELPAMSSAVGTTDEIASLLRKRLSSGLRRIAFFIVPSAVAFLVLGDVLAAGLYQSGRFNHANAVYVWSVLAGSAVGLLATSLGRLYSSAFYALLDTKTPLRFAVIRVILTTGLGVIFALYLPEWLGIDPKWGVAGLTASAGIAGWVEFTLLRHALGDRIGKVGISAGFAAKLWFTALVAAGLGYTVKISVGIAHPLLLAIAVVCLFGIVYFAGTALLGIPESRSTIASIKRYVDLVKRSSS